MHQYPNKLSYRGFDKLILFGGSFLMARLVERLTKEGGVPFVVFSAARHLDDTVGENGETLREGLERLGAHFFESDDINRDKVLSKEVTQKSLGIAMGAAWVFEKRTVSFFKEGYLLDVMGIDLPRYQGGAHYSWQILHGNRKGAAHLQIILGGKETFHRGPVILFKTYAIPKEAKIPQDYFEFLCRKETEFLHSFLTMARQGKEFTPRPLDEQESSFYPFLSTAHQGFINWSWKGEEIVRFIDAFDDPYRGASTFISKKRVSLKGAQLRLAEEHYHPFTSGLVVRKDTEGIFVAAHGALLYVRGVRDEDGRDVKSEIALGERLYTPQAVLDAAMECAPDYQPRGLQNI